jgi:hypothetical protein
MKCDQCKDPILDFKDIIKCAQQGCGRIFHYHCTGLRESVFSKMSEEAKSNWLCLKCKGAKNEKKFSGANNLEAGSKDKDSEGSFQGFNVEEILCSVNKKLSLINTISTDLESIKEVTNEIKSSQEFLSKQYDKFEEALKILPKMEKEIKQLRETIVVKDRLINDLTVRVNQLEQYGRNKNLEINEVAEVKGENVEDLVRKISEKAGVQLKEEDIEVAHRLPKTKTENRPATIIVQFTTRKMRDKVFAARKKIVTNAEVTGQQSGRIYISENLSFFYRNLLKKAKLKARGLNYKYTWYRNGTVRVRKEADGQVIVIEKEEDLEKIK